MTKKYLNFTSLQVSKVIIFHFEPDNISFAFENAIKAILANEIQVSKEYHDNFSIFHLIHSNGISLAIIAVTTANKGGKEGQS